MMATYVKTIKHTRRLHPILILLSLCAATLLTGALALSGSSVGSAASERPHTGVAQNVQKPAVAPRTPQTGTAEIVFEYAGDIWVMNPDGSGQTNLTNSPEYEATPSWSPGHIRIAYTCEIQICVMNADGTNRISLTSSSVQSSDPAWSPLGDKIAFRTNPPGQTVIAVMNTDGSGQVFLTNENDAGDYRPAWSPDGSKIAFVRLPYGGVFNVYVMNANGTNQVNLTNSSMNELDPAWSPDGSRIAFARQLQGANYSIHLMDANGGNVTNITNSPYPQIEPTWSSSGSKIAFNGHFDPGGLGVFSPGGLGVFSMNPDGSDLALLADHGKSPDWRGGTIHLVQVKDEAGNPVQGAEVYRNNILLGTADSRGVVNLPSPSLDEHLIARTMVYTGTTLKGSHDVWLYHVWLTSVTQENNGDQTTYTITDTQKITQTVVLKKSNAQIGLNVVGSMNYNATQANLADIAAGLKKASEYLFDVTDGQMFYEKFTLYEDNQNLDDADIQFSPWIWPQATLSGIRSTTGHLYMPGPGFNGKTYTGGWQQPDGYRTYVHEFGHYAFGAYDEYKILGGAQGSASCTLDRDSVPEDSRASIMSFQYDSTEICVDANHNAATAQGQTLGESVWGTFVRNWRDAQSTPRWTLRTPSTRGAVDPGPSSLLVINDLDATVVESSAATCDTVLNAQATVVLTGTTIPLNGLGVYLSHGGQTLYEGDTDSNGNIKIYGAALGDIITTTGALLSQPDVIYASSNTINSCSDPLSLVWQPVIGGPSQGQSPSSFTHYWLTSTLNRALGTVSLSLHFDGQPSSAPVVTLSQDGGPYQAVALTYDPITFTYNGTIAYDPAHALHFMARASVPTASGSLVSSYTLSGAEYHTSGPFIGDGVQQLPQRLVPPSWWEIFSSEDMVSLSVNSTSLSDGTGVMVTQTDMPPGTPPNLLAVGGPFSIEGDSPIPVSGQVGASLNFQAELYCGLEPESIAVYKYDPASGTWTALPTNLNIDWNQAYVNLSQWGIYTVFAQPNTVSAFSDVPSDNTFFTYVQWVACHGIASGYADGTFRVGANATRGQISKMVSVAYSWDLEPLEGGGYTFADVPTNHTFYLYIEAAYRMGVLGGYPCGGDGEPCDGQNRPYFRPGNNATRGQIAKILSNASVFNETVSGQTFADVPTTHAFYEYVERMSSRGIIGGYACGGTGEPCDGENRPYFRPGNNATRGQLSKMIYLTLQPR